MDVSTYLQSFEESMTSYTGDDPLDSWTRFYDFLEKRVPSEDAKGLSIVLDRLVQRFLEDGRYSNDIRYVNYCIKCASYYDEPIKLYSYIHSKGIGTTTAALYVAWAQQFEQLHQHQHADAVYQTAIENQAKPSDTVLQQYRMFQSRTSRRSAGVLDGPHPLQNSQLANQTSSHREPGPQCKEPEDLSQLPADRTVHIISRSENAVRKPSNQGSASSLQTVSMYCKDSLECQGSELCFEEVRAAKYYVRRKQEEECRELEVRQRLAREKENELQRMKQLLDDLENNVEPTGSSPSNPPTQQVQCNTTATSLNPECLHQSFRQPPPLHSLKNQPSVDQRLNWAPDVKPDSERAPGALTQCRREISFLREPVADLSTQRCSPPFGLGLTDHWAAPTPSTHPQAAPPLQAPVVGHNPQPSEGPCTALQRPAWSRGAQNEAPHLESHPHMNHLSSSFQQFNVRDQNMSACEAAESKLDVSQGATGNLSHVTPNTSLGIAHATPSRVLPSPTVNTREALDVIMDMFLAPTLLQDEPFSCLAQAEKSFDAGYHRMGDATSFNKPPSVAPFAIFQDENDKENCSPAVTVDKPRPSRALVEIPVSKQEKPNETPTELIPEESTMWGARYNSLISLAACPNNTGDFSLSAHMVSTPFQKKEPYSRDFEEDQEIDDPRTFIGPEEKPYMRQPMKLSPIIEQRSDENLQETVVGSTRGQGLAEQGTIVGEGLALEQGSLTACSMTEVHHAPALLSFRDHTLVPPQGPEAASSPPGASGAGWDVYMSPEQPPQAACPPSLVPHGAPLRRSQGFTLKSAVSPEKDPDPEPGVDVPMSPECVPMPEWLVIRSPEVGTEWDLDALMSPQGPRKADVLPQESTDIPMSPEHKFSMDVPMSPAWIQKAGVEAAMSPRQELNEDVDVPMSPSAGAAAGRLVSDPWDEELISRLLETLSTPLTSHPDCTTWQCKVPNISPKMTIKMGAGSLRVDSLLGEGAFATVYQATDLSTSKKMVLKVQKPGNPWEFYINTQLNARLQPSIRHLFSNVLSAHLFQNGSVLLADLHNCGTLLNAVNLYRNQSDKVMPQPLVMYFTICILYMVEQLHSIHIVHADIKPDNFLLGERFLDNTSFEPENLDHGLALIDLGQSIDMTLFPEGTEFTAKCMTSGFQCTEMLSGRPWNYQTDYFGIAGTVYCMIFGTYMQVKNEDGVWKTNAVFRRNPHSDLWNELFHTLLNVQDCRSLPSLSELRSRLCSVLQQNYRTKLASLKTRLVIQLLESRSARR